MTADRPGKITFGHLVSLGSRLTNRDRQIALDCYDHHVLTTEQLVRLHFAGLRTATARLDALYKLRVLDRFRPDVRPLRSKRGPGLIGSLPPTAPTHGGGPARGAPPALAEAARLIREAVRDKSYQLTPIGADAAGYLRAKRKRLTDSSYRDYESCLDKLARHFLDLQIEDFEPPTGTERIEEFLDATGCACACCSTTACVRAHSKPSSSSTSTTSASA
jgi:hypothetical protein